MNEIEIDQLSSIGEQIRTQDNRATSEPLFCVQVCKRYGPIITDYGDDKLMFHVWDHTETYYEDRPDPELWKVYKKKYDEGELKDSEVMAGCYIEVWETVCVCFTEQGCERHLELNGHNYRNHFGTRIYVEHLNRNEEMVLIRKFLSENMAA